MVCETLIGQFTEPINGALFNFHPRGRKKAKKKKKKYLSYAALIVQTQRPSNADVSMTYCLTEKSDVLGCQRSWHWN